MTKYLTACATLFLALGAFAFTPKADACGGLFCDSTQPVNQAAERIIFSSEDDGSTTAVIQIFYEGPSEEFAWMLPVQGTPEVGVSSNFVFQALQNATNPTYRLNTTVEGQCDSNDFLAGSPENDGVRDAGANGDSGSQPPVQVLEQGSVGPYDYAIISVNGGEEPGQAAREWLSNNGYDVNDFGIDRITPYLEAGMNLIAFRLSKDSESGDVRPIRLSFGPGLPSIPLRPTAVAAVEDMGIMVWVLGESRAVPTNYLSLELNEARINWFAPNSNYNDVVTLAANEAGGQGFVTEFAGDAPPLAEQILPTWLTQELTFVRENALSEDVVRTLAFNFAGFDGFGAAVRAHFPRPEGIRDEDWEGRPLEAILNAELAADYYTSVDYAAFLARAEESVFGPVEATIELFKGAVKATRFYTTMSADEMVLDPVFHFNSELGDYDRNHVANRIIECHPGVTQADAPWRTLLSNGVIVRGEGGSWPLATDDRMPALLSAGRYGDTAEPENVIDNARPIGIVVESNNERFPRRPGGGFTGGSSGCSTTGSNTTVPLAIALFLGSVLFMVRRRKES